MLLFVKIFAYTFLIWTFQHTNELSTLCKTWDNTKKLSNASFSIRIGRLLRSETDIRDVRNYGFVKRELINVVENGNDKSFQKKRNPQKHLKNIENSYNSFIYDDSLDKSDDSLGNSCSSNNSLDITEYDNNHIIKPNQNKQTYPELLKCHSKPRIKNTPFNLVNFFKEMDAQFEVKLLRSLKHDSTAEDCSIKHKSIFKKFLHYTSRHKILLPPVALLITVFLLIALQYGSTVTCPVILLSIAVSSYYFIKVKKCNSISKFFRSFMSSNKNIK
ncbi:Plasmodium exported protein, unknown function [Plasmodium gonderi]|uniref:Pv-fam-d protein n=1 Tax=Plasmodium gonderi TaxID=77519 RepID=A0A1Y1JMD8_PLAGO|nr:Plasmodium exported protein, unknown function [Plasmodium gonderi]GAW81553.1 Plasmodium exported protein, unknown function [Plasmodium gonderi]